MGGRVALVTGAGRGIGRATAELLTQRGARVMAVSRSEEELASLAQLGSIEYLVESVATPDGCQRIIDETKRRMGHIDILVNNAGMGTKNETQIWRADPDVWSASLAVNLTAPFELTRLTLPAMIERGFGRIVMVGSVASTASGVGLGMPAYVATKHGLLGLTRAVSLDVARYGITCNAVLPGLVRTRMAEENVERASVEAGISNDEAWSTVLSRYHAGRFVTPGEVAETIAFLASDHASGVNGVGVLVALQGRV
jgi:NAD(P)-dependent dehydrogenase (short-subunit alcohol dehydrogenase family)